MAHVVVSCLALVTGLAVSLRMLTHKALGLWPRNFFVLAFGASTSGFFFPITDLTPSHLIGIASLLVLGVTLRGYYVAHQHGTWRAIYRLGVIVSTYLLALVAVTQTFMKTPALQTAGSHGSPDAFVGAQTLLLVLAIAACVCSFRHPAGQKRQRWPRRNQVL
jgi:hypothetical protein